MPEETTQAEPAEQPAEQSAEQAAPAEASSAQTNSGDVEILKEPVLEEPKPEAKPDSENTYDPRLRNEDGTFNEDGAKEYAKEKESEKAKYEKRIKDFRVMVSDKTVPEKADEYLQDYVPEESKFVTFFENEKTKEDLKVVTDELQQKYHDLALSKKQGAKMTDMVLRILESVDVLDTRTADEKYTQQLEWVNEQKKMLGPNGDNIIREAKVFVDSQGAFGAKTKNYLYKMMDDVGAEAINAVHQMKDAYGGNSASIPTNVSDLGGLKSDRELKDEYLDKGTSDYRRQEITLQRNKAGRKGRLMDAGL